MKTELEKMTKAEILEAIDILAEWGDVDPERIPEFREDVIYGKGGTRHFNKCAKYRQPLIDYIYRRLK